MLKLIKNEIKKIVLSRKYMVAMLVLLILYIGTVFMVYRDITKSTPQARLDNNKKYIEFLNKQKESKSISEKEKNEIEYKLKDIDMQNKNLEFQRDNMNIDWHEKLKKQNKIIEEKIRGLGSKDSNGQVAQFTKQLKENEYCLKNDIKPSENYKVNAFNIMLQVNMIFSMLIVTLIIAIITSDSISGEFAPATIKLLLTKPVSREKVLLSKFLASIIVCVGSFLALKLIMFLIIGVVFSFGNYKEPIAFYAKYINDEELIARIGFGVKADINSIKIYSILKFMLLGEAFNLLFIITCVSINFLISTITKKSVSSVSISVILFVIASIVGTSQVSGDVGKNPILHSIAPYLFSTYSSGELIVTGGVTTALGASFANVNFAILILLVWTTVCYIIANLIFVKKDII